MYPVALIKSFSFFLFSFFRKIRFGPVFIYFLKPRMVLPFFLFLSFVSISLSVDFRSHGNQISMVILTHNPIRRVHMDGTFCLEVRHIRRQIRNVVYTRYRYHILCLAPKGDARCRFYLSIFSFFPRALPTNIKKRQQWRVLDRNTRFCMASLSEQKWWNLSTWGRKQH
jgi:hypothetical protein